MCNCTYVMRVIKYRKNNINLKLLENYSLIIREKHVCYLLFCDSKVHLHLVFPV